MEIGHVIAQLREKKGISQKKLAKDLHMTPGAIGMWETNSRLPKLNMFVELADYFQIDSDILLQYDRKVSPEDRIYKIEDIVSAENNINSSTNNQIELMTKTFLELSESNQYILLGKAMELLKEESITTSTSSTSNEKGA